VPFCDTAGSEANPCVRDPGDIDSRQIETFEAGVRYALSGVADDR
jgi:hypothetical protein